MRRVAAPAVRPQPRTREGLVERAQRAAAIAAALEKAYPEVACPLAHRNVFELLVAVMLSAHTTDKSVNAATRKLYPVANTPAKILALGEEGVKPYLKTVGLYNAKSKNLIELCRRILELHQGEVAIFVGPGYIVSVRRNTTMGFVDVRRRCEQEPELLRHGPAYVLYALMDAVVDRYFPVLDDIVEEAENVEERIFSGQNTRAQIEALYGLRRKLMLLDRATGPLLEVTSKLHGGRVPPICAGLHDYFRDVYDHLIRLKQHIENLREMAATVMSVNLSLITIQTLNTFDLILPLTAGGPARATEVVSLFMYRSAFMSLEAGRAAAVAVLLLGLNLLLAWATVTLLASSARKMRLAEEGTADSHGDASHGDGSHGDASHGDGSQHDGHDEHTLADAQAHAAPAH